MFKTDCLITVRGDQVVIWWCLNHFTTQEVISCFVKADLNPICQQELINVSPWLFEMWLGSTNDSCDWFSLSWLCNYLVDFQVLSSSINVKTAALSTCKSIWKACLCSQHEESKCLLCTNYQLVLQSLAALSMHMSCLWFSAQLTLI